MAVFAAAAAAIPSLNARGWTLSVLVLIFPGLCHTGNMRSALNDAAAARKINPDHLKALIRGMINKHTCFSLCSNNMTINVRKCEMLE